MNLTPPCDTRRTASPTAAADPARPAPARSEPAGATTLGLAHACPHCGQPIAVVNVLVPVDEPASCEQQPEDETD